MLATSFGVTTAINEITQNGDDECEDRSDFGPHGRRCRTTFFAGYEALAARLAVAEPGAELPIYVAPQAEVKLTVKTVTGETAQTPAGSIATTRDYDVVIQNPGGPLDATVTIDDKARLAKLEIPAASLSVVRTDLASVAVRRRPRATRPTLTSRSRRRLQHRRNADAAARSVGRPAAPPGRRPGRRVGPGRSRRDRRRHSDLRASSRARSPTSGFMVLRYDKRGVGQSGGRTETATLHDYAEDLVADVSWLREARRRGRRRMAVAGHSEGGAVAMLAAAARRGSRRSCSSPARAPPAPN